KLEIEQAIKETKEALAGGDVEEIKRKQETLMTASHKLSEVLYSQAQQEAGSAEATDTDDLVEDAEVVDEDDEEERK
ncbi:MAG: molecular chaperone DnaK, partial [Actinomycetota bacterium]|nr:molecular chaperone DnaK [Actinomycetota bacterium]